MYKRQVEAEPELAQTLGPHGPTNPVGFWRVHHEEAACAGAHHLAAQRSGGPGGVVHVDQGAVRDVEPIALGIERPRVGLLSVGEEAGKGTELVREAHGLLAASGLNFVGNREARDFCSGRADVIVCDGFTGNVALKVGEGLVDAMEVLLKKELAKSLAARLGGRLAKAAFLRVRDRADSAEYGGAPLLGLKGLALVGHGRSDARAVRNGIATAARLVEGQLVQRLRDALVNP